MTFRSVFEMGADELRMQSIVVPVARGYLQRGQRLSIPPEHGEKDRALRDVVSKALPERSLLEPFMHRLLSIEFPGDVFYSQLESGAIIILVDEAVFRSVGEDRILRQVHCSELEAAHRRGDEIDVQLLLQYRNAPAVQIAETVDHSN